MAGRKLLFITRKWDGRGGMQQLSRDIWRGMLEGYGGDARLCTMTQSPLFVVHCSLFVFFAGKAMVLGVMTVWRDGCVHLGDAALAPLGWFLKKVGRGRVTITVCGLDAIWPRRWYQRLLRRTLPAMDCVVCISRATAEAVRERGVDPGKTRSIPCGVWPLMRSVAIPALACPANPNRAGPRLPAGQAGSSRMAPLLLTVGRLVSRKGVVWFVREVMPRLLRAVPQLQYVIVGAGPEESLIKKIIQEKGLGHCVHVRGELDASRREECFALADFFVAPNVPVAGDMEGFGIVCTEAGLRGVPVAAARIEGLRDAVIDGKTGRFFTPGDAEDCAKVVREVIESTWDRERVARATLEHYGWPRLFRRYRDEVFGF